MAGRTRTNYDAVVVGSGPNGLSAAIRLAEAGCHVLLIEGRETIGGGLRTAELTLPGFAHDVCATVLGTYLASPYLSKLPLAQYGLEIVQPEIPLAHPFDETDKLSGAAALYRSVERTAEGLGADGDAWQRLMGPFVEEATDLMPGILAPLQLPRHPLLMGRFARAALRSGRGLAQARFAEESARALFAGLAAHSLLPLEKAATAAFGLVLGIAAHAVGWPFARGGSQALANALAAHLRALGGEIVTGMPVERLDQLPAARAVLLDVSPRTMLRIAGDRFPAGYRRRLEQFHYGPGVFKIDWALSEPIPWRSSVCRRAGTLHLGGSMAEISASERAMWQGAVPESPFVLLVQQTLFDPTRAPAGQHTAWAYCHVPHASTADMTEAIEAQVERYAPGFRDCIRARHTFTAIELERYNPNYVGGAITGGAQDVTQLFTRPVARLNPYTTPLDGLYLCSASTPPGGGVHGMCGYFAAETALSRI